MARPAMDQLGLVQAVDRLGQGVVVGVALLPTEGSMLSSGGPCGGYAKEDDNCLAASPRFRILGFAAHGSSPL